VGIAKWYGHGIVVTQETLLPRQPEPLEDRLTRFIEPGENGCWIWTGPIRRGSPMLKVDGERRCIRPLLYEMLHGGRPHSSMVDRPQIKMRCDVEGCVSPDHMKVATDEDRLLRQLRQEIYLRGLARAQANPGCRFMITPRYIEAEARRQLDARLAAQMPPTPEVQNVLDQIQRRLGAQGPVQE
jgi:hypothetical protein